MHNFAYLFGLIKAVRHRNVMLNWWNWFSMHSCHGCKCTANDTFNKSNRNEYTTNPGWLYCTPFHGASRTISKSPDRILLSQCFFSFRFPMWCLLLELFYIKFLLFIECLSGVCIHMNWWSQMENKNTRPTKTKAETQFFRAFFHTCFAFGAMCNPLCLWWSSSTLNVLVFGRPYNDCRSAD